MVDMDSTIKSNPNDARKAPLHRVIAENLSHKINNGDLKTGEKLPSERQIAQQYNASRATVRTALQHLEQEGIITRRDRRSAIVTLRRDVKPNLRIAVTSHSLMRAMRVLNEKQLLPARTQLQAINIACPNAVSNLVTQPASGADILICDIDFINCWRSNDGLFNSLKLTVTGDAEIEEQLLSVCMDQGRLMAVPLGVSPMILYYNRAILQEIQAFIPQGDWHWDQLIDYGSRISKSGRFGLQMKPGFAQLTSLFTGFGGQLYQSNGKLAVDSQPTFDNAVRFLCEHIGGSGIIAPITSELPIDLFADGRCGMAIDGYDKYTCYRDKLGDNLGIASLPGARSDGRVSRAIVMMILKPMEDLQPVEDMLRTFLSNNVQSVIASEGLAAPVRKDLLTKDFMVNAGVSSEMAELLVKELGSMKPVALPSDDRLTVATHQLFTELWLGVDCEENLIKRLHGL